MPSLLITDDHPLYITGLETALKQWYPALHVFTANDIEDSKNCLTSYPDIDLMLLDRTLAGTDGLQHLAELQEMSPKLRIAIISGWESNTYIQEAINAGAVGFIPKRFDAESIAKAIRRLLTVGLYIPDDLFDSQPDQYTANQLLFTPQQYRTLLLLDYGLSNREIAQQLDVSEGAIKQYVYAICKKLGVKNRLQAVRVARMRGIIC
jgi:DNA-binding NarL/FixJ family response regulator